MSGGLYMGDRALEGFPTYPHSIVVPLKMGFIVDFTVQNRDFLLLYPYRIVVKRVYIISSKKGKY